MRDSHRGHLSGALGAIAGVAWALAVAPGTAQAFTREFAPGEGAPCLFWNTRRVAFATNDQGSRDAGEDAFGAVSASFAAWSATCSDFSFQDLGRTARRDVGYSPQDAGRPTLVVWREALCSKTVPASDPCWRSSCANAYGCWDHDPGMIALTTTSFDRSTGEILHADIELNGASFVFTARDSPSCDKEAPVPRPAPCAANDVQNTLTHEVGHLLGLDHSLDAEATMYRTAPLGETKKRDLASDDVEGLCFIYPRAMPTSTCLSPSAPAPRTAAAGCQCGVSGGAALPILPFLAGFLRRRRRGV